MGMCKPSGGIYTQTGRVGSLPRIWLPNTRIDLLATDRSAKFYEKQDFRIFHGYRKNLIN